jgi:hypothetical protein
LFIFGEIPRELTGWKKKCVGHGPNWTWIQGKIEKPHSKEVRKNTGKNLWEKFMTKKEWHF